MRTSLPTIGSTTDASAETRLTGGLPGDAAGHLIGRIVVHVDLFREGAAIVAAQRVQHDLVHGDLSAYSFHMADQGTDAMEREKAFLFASKEGRYLYHIDEALRRLYRVPEKFGECEDCGKDIGIERLEALPHTRLCIKCKEKEETGAAR